MLNSHRWKNLFRSFPEERLKPTRSKEIAFNVLGALLVLLLLNGFANGFLTYLISQRSFFLASYKWNLLNRIEKPVDWLVLGDSSCNQGIIPEILSQELDGTALNLCIFGPLLAFNDAWMLEQHIRRVGPPKNVVIIHVYDLWERDLGDETFAHLSRIPMAPETLKSFSPSLELNFGHRLQWFAFRYLHLYTSSDTIVDFLREPVETLKGSREFTVTSSGFMPKYNPNPRDVEEDVAEHINIVQDKDFEISEINQRSLEAIQVLAETYEFDVYFVSSSFYEKLYNRPKFRRYLRKVRRGLRDFTRSSDRLHVVMDEPLTFDKHQMENVDHLIKSAAEIYTQQVGEQLREEEAKR
jgi:hypothetical protein